MLSAKCVVQGLGRQLFTARGDSAQLSFHSISANRQALHYGCPDVPDVNLAGEPTHITLNLIVNYLVVGEANPSFKARTAVLLFGCDPNVTPTFQNLLL